MGAEAVKSLLDHLDLDAEMALLQKPTSWPTPLRSASARPSG